MTNSDTSSGKEKTRTVWIVAAAVTAFSLVLGIIALVLVSATNEAKEKQRALAAAIQRPSEVTEQDFSSKCSPQNRCIGKFIAWTGIVQADAPTGTMIVRVRTFNGEANLHLNSALQFTLPVGDKILFHGLIRELNQFANDEIADGFVRKTLATANQIKVDIENQEHAAEAKAVSDRMVQDQEDASKMGVSLKDYLVGKGMNSEARVHCQDAVVKQDQWGGNADWTPDYSWRIEGRFIHISGKDVRLKNGFGAERQVSYKCLYDLDSKSPAVEEIQ